MLSPLREERPHSGRHFAHSAHMGAHHPGGHEGHPVVQVSQSDVMVEKGTRAYAHVSRLTVAALVTVVLVAASPPQASADAICNDGTYSDADGQGACSWHDGVDEWLNRDESSYSDAESSPSSGQNETPALLVGAGVVGAIVYGVTRQRKS